MMGMLASLGIEKGKTFSPDETAKRAMRQAAIDFWFQMYKPITTLFRANSSSGPTGITPLCCRRTPTARLPGNTTIAST